MYVVSQNGKLDGKQLLPSGYLKEATVKQSDPYGKSGSWEEMQGYGYQIWMTTHNGYAFFGMGEVSPYLDFRVLVTCSLRL